MQNTITVSTQTTCSRIGLAHTPVPSITSKSVSFACYLRFGYMCRRGKESILSRFILFNVTIINIPWNMRVGMPQGKRKTSSNYEHASVLGAGSWYPQNAVGAIGGDR